MTERIGRIPIPIPAFILGKLAFLFSFLFCCVKWLHIAAMLYDSPVTEMIGIVLFFTGLTIVVVGVVQLGQSRAFGLPETETTLKTEGLYRVSRHPMYLGGFIMGLGSCFYSIHVINMLLFACAVATHMLIIRREEEFLADRFGQQWFEYREQVPRLLGPFHRSPKVRNTG